MKKNLKISKTCNCYRDHQCIGFILSSISVRLLFELSQSVCSFFLMVLLHTRFKCVFPIGILWYFSKKTTSTSLTLCPEYNENPFCNLIWVYVLMFFFNMEMQLFSKIVFQIFFWFIKLRINSAIRYPIVVVSIVWKLPPKHHTIPAEVPPNDSEALST